MISMMTKESTVWILYFGIFVTMALKSHDDQPGDKGKYRLDIWRPNLGKCQGLGGKIRRSEGYWKNHRHMITVNNMAKITRKKKSRLLLLGLAQMQQTQPVSWYCNLFYDAFHSAIKIFTSPLLFWVKKNMGRALGFCTP